MKTMSDVILLAFGVIFLGSGIIETVFGVWNSKYWFAPAISLFFGLMLILILFVKGERNE